jgi:hypothetical protein
VYLITDPAKSPWDSNSDSYTNAKLYLSIKYYILIKLLVHYLTLKKKNKNPKSGINGAEAENVMAMKNTDTVKA